MDCAVSECCSGMRRKFLHFQVFKLSVSFNLQSQLSQCIQDTSTKSEEKDDRHFLTKQLEKELTLFPIARA